jgi:hypothetical protein
MLSWQLIESYKTSTYDIKFSKKYKQYNDQMKKYIMKRQTRIYKALHRKLNIEQHVPHETAVG